MKSSYAARNKEIVNLINKGLSYQQVANKMKISTSNVRTTYYRYRNRYTSNVKRKKLQIGALVEDLKKEPCLTTVSHKYKVTDACLRLVLQKHCLSIKDFKNQKEKDLNWLKNNKDQLGVTIFCDKKMLHRFNYYGVRLMDITAQNRKREILRLHYEGNDVSTIMSKLNLSDNTIYKYLKQEGINAFLNNSFKKLVGKNKDQRDKSIYIDYLALKEKGMKKTKIYDELAAKYGYTPINIYYSVRRFENK